MLDCGLLLLDGPPGGRGFQSVRSLPDLEQLVHRAVNKFNEGMKE